MLFQMITYTTQETVSHVLTQEGAQIALQGSHEARVWNACPTKGEAPPVPIKELQTKVGVETAKIGQGQAFKNKWIGKEGDGLIKLVCQSARMCPLCTENSFRSQRLWIQLNFRCGK